MMAASSMEETVQTGGAPAPASDSVDVEAIMRDIRRSVEEKRQANIYPHETWERQPRFVAVTHPDSTVEEHLVPRGGGGPVRRGGEPITPHRPFLGEQAPRREAH